MFVLTSACVCLTELHLPSSSAHASRPMCGVSCSRVSVCGRSSTEQTDTQPEWKMWTEDSGLEITTENRYESVHMWMRYDIWEDLRAKGEICIRYLSEVPLRVTASTLTRRDKLERSHHEQRDACRADRSVLLFDASRRSRLDSQRAVSVVKITDAIQPNVFK